jgi:uncharacterized protein YggE
MNGYQFKTDEYKKYIFGGFKMSSRFKLLFVVVLLAASLLGLVVVNAAAKLEGQISSAIAVQAEPAEVPRNITVVGEGSVNLEPDIAIINVGAEAREQTVSEAKVAVDSQMAEIVTALQNMGVSEKDIQTSRYNIHYVREPVSKTADGSSPEIFEGYSVSNMVRVTVRQAAKAGDVLDAVVQAGANLAYGVTFTVSDVKTWESQARAEAMTDARSRAQELASLAEVELGEVISVSEVIGDVSIPALMEAGSPSGGVGSNPGELEFSTRIQVVFAVR